MQNNSDGLSPSIRPNLGIGWNRALPAAFGFDNGINPDGVNDRLIVDFRGIIPPTHFSVEFWYNSTTTAPNNRGFFCFTDIVNNTRLSTNQTATAFLIVNIANQGVQVGRSGFDGNRHYVCYNITSTPTTIQFSLQLDGLAIISTSTLGTQDWPTFWDNLTLFVNQASGTMNIPMDEFRVYNRHLTKSEMDLNYNMGIGNNPCVTENLLVWFKFQEFEILDFSLLQDNSDVKLGIRDFSGNNRHGLPMNMDTNPASPTYVLKPF